MPITARRSRLQQLCACRNKIYAHQKKKPRDHCKRKRQAFVYNPEEEIWHEPYMQSLRREFSDESVLCDSKIELPWRDIALRSAMRIRPDATAVEVDQEMDETETRTVDNEKRESTGAITLPWQDLLITEILRSTLDEPELCDSSVEIPWADLALEKPVEIRPSREERTCVTDDVEIPWNEILMPRNIVIRSERKRRHPSSKRPPRPRVDTTCIPYMSDTINREASKSSDTPKRRDPVDHTSVNHSDKKCLFSVMKQKIRSKLPTFHNPLKRFMKSKSERESDSEAENVNHYEICPHVLEKIDELANVDSASTLNEEDTEKSNTSDYQFEHHPMDAARTRESYQDLASYFSEVDPDEPSTSATNTIVLSTSTFDRDLERTEPSENLQSTTMTSTTSTSFGSEITDTVSNSMNTEEVSDADFTNALQRGTIVAVAPMGLAFSAQLGNEIINVSETTTESRTRDQRIGRDDPREFYNNTLRMVVIRKPICPQNDEPSIY
ncbi:hypothetical protein ALC60_03143 [Trachymyrmex zeteki]|uniref:Uncharacterized protein n=2 Tax=Mycetomoellerius zeteki TaxID=64791 RepID=A0A151XCI6_9HYME|nr:hypothetical protein ALC60_03143 [Trachymyrmex zeteki]